MNSKRATRSESTNAKGELRRVDRRERVVEIHVRDANGVVNVRLKLTAVSLSGEEKPFSVGDILEVGDELLVQIDDQTAWGVAAMGLGVLHPPLVILEDAS